MSKQPWTYEQNAAAHAYFRNLIQEKAKRIKELLVMNNDLRGELDAECRVSQMLLAETKKLQDHVSLASDGLIVSNLICEDAKLIPEEP